MADSKPAGKEPAKPKLAQPRAKRFLDAGPAVKVIKEPQGKEPS